MLDRSILYHIVAFMLQNHRIHRILIIRCIEILFRVYSTFKFTKNWKNNFSMIDSLDYRWSSFNFSRILLARKSCCMFHLKASFVTYYGFDMTPAGTQVELLITWGSNFFITTYIKVLYPQNLKMKGETFKYCRSWSTMFSIFGYLKNHLLQVLIFIYSFGKSKPEIITSINIDESFWENV